MNRHVKPRTMSAREFNQNTSGAKKATEAGPLIITDRGQPAYVLMTHAEFERLTLPRKSLWDVLATKDTLGDIDIMEFIPSRHVEPLGDPFADFDFDRESN